MGKWKPTHQVFSRWSLSKVLAGAKTQKRNESPWLAILIGHKFLAKLEKSMGSMQEVLQEIAKNDEKIPSPWKGAYACCCHRVTAFERRIDCSQGRVESWDLALYFPRILQYAYIPDPRKPRHCPETFNQSKGKPPNHIHPNTTVTKSFRLPQMVCVSGELSIVFRKIV